MTARDAAAAAARRRRRDAYARERRAMVARILARFDGATAADAAAGIAWYARAAAAAAAIADRHGVDIETAAAVVAATSPRQGWARNLVDADSIIGAWVRGDADPPARGLPENRARAWRVLAAAAAGDDVAAALGRGPKVGAFYRNLAGDVHAVTVDSWALRAALGPGAPDSVKGPRYARVAAAYRAAAAARGVAPRDLQAAVWVTIRGGAD